MNFVNLTPHTINFSNGTSIQPAGAVARVATVQEKIGAVDGIEIFQTVFGNVENLPETKENTIYIVSSLVASRCNNRNDVLVPCNFIRDDKGRIVAAGGLQKI